MDVDRARLEALSSYEDREEGIRERFLTPELGGARTVAVLSEPLEAHPSAGWVICHSFGSEFDALGAFDAALARRLAAAGCAALRFHAQGYGDSELEADQMSLERHVLGATEAAGLIPEATGVSSVGFVGARFGGSVAAIAAGQTSAPALAAIDPAVNGRSFLRGLVWLDRTADLADEDGRSAREDPWAEAAQTGVFELEGVRLPQEVVATIGSLNLLKDLSSFRGRCLVLQLSRSAEPRPELQRLVQRLTDLGGDCTHDTVVGEDATRFGRPPWRSQGVDRKINVLADFTETILDKTVSWCVGSPDPASATSHDA